MRRHTAEALYLALLGLEPGELGAHGQVRPGGGGGEGRGAAAVADGAPGQVRPGGGGEGKGEGGAQRWRTGALRLGSRCTRWGGACAGLRLSTRPPVPAVVTGEVHAHTWAFPAPASCGPSPPPPPRPRPQAVSGEEAEAAQELLLGTPWDGDLDGARAARDALAAALHVPVPATRAAAPAGGAGGKKAVRDEYASYQALLDDFARI